ncbi:hypothetical protein M514_11519 [Trichuris suis]|uniref:Uncharacterized protein n=1 Tax=Trichuris suis TaxID=68888 RepID=A0A085LRK4_9BILA|nr:hypothetical protein M513_11519 [Trichuris suis]KFD67626.1 hypothetical protein M514_11519 [Trichuris suis]
MLVPLNTRYISLCITVVNRVFESEVNAATDSSVNGFFSSTTTASREPSSLASNSSCRLFLACTAINFMSSSDFKTFKISKSESILSSGVDFSISALLSRTKR